MVPGGVVAVDLAGHLLHHRTAARRVDPGVPDPDVAVLGREALGRIRQVQRGDQAHRGGVADVGDPNGRTCPDRWPRPARGWPGARARPGEAPGLLVRAPLVPVMAVCALEVFALRPDPAGLPAAALPRWPPSLLAAALLAGCLGSARRGASRAAARRRGAWPGWPSRRPRPGAAGPRRARPGRACARTAGIREGPGRPEAEEHRQDGREQPRPPRPGRRRLRSATAATGRIGHEGTFGRHYPRESPT